jgi:hypothetical protein
MDHQQGDGYHLKHALPPSSNEPNMPSAVPSTQEGLTSMPSMGIPWEVHNVSTTKSGKVHPSSLHHILFIDIFISNICGRSST